MTDTQDKKPIADMTFEERTYAYAKAWAQMSRRDFLKTGAALGGAAAFAGLGMPRAHAAKPGGTLRIARGQESDTLDPQKTTLLVAHEIAWQIYDSLIYLDETGTVYPGLATSWEFSNEGKTVTLKLREGVNFHDGSPFNAEVVRWTVERHLADTTASPTSWMLGPIAGTEVIDDMTIAYHYTAPFVPLWVGLGYSYCAPISKAGVEAHGDAFGRNPIGTGPFKFVRWDPDQGIELVRNDEHNWATPWYSNEGNAYVERVEYVVIPEDATRIAALLSGDVDVHLGHRRGAGRQAAPDRGDGRLQGLQPPGGRCLLRDDEPEDGADGRSPRAPGDQLRGQPRQDHRPRARRRGPSLPSARWRPPTASTTRRPRPTATATTWRRPRRSWPRRGSPTASP